MHDAWKAYDEIPNLPVNPRYEDDTVVHKYEFVNVRGRTTNHAERYWREIKYRYSKYVINFLTILGKRFFTLTSVIHCGTNWL